MLLPSVRRAITKFSPAAASRLIHWRRNSADVPLML